MTKKILEVNSTKRKYTRQLRINQSTILWINCVHRDRKIDCVCEHIDFRWKTDGACRAQLACVCVVLCLCFAPHSYRRHGIHQADETTAAAATATHSSRLIYSYTFVLSFFNLCWALFHFIVIEIYTRSSTTNTHVLCSVLTQTTITDKCGSSSWHYIVSHCIGHVIRIRHHYQWKRKNIMNVWYCGAWHSVYGLNTWRAIEVVRA